MTGNGVVRFIRALEPWKWWILVVMVLAIAILGVEIQNWRLLEWVKSLLSELP